MPANSRYFSNSYTSPSSLLKTIQAARNKQEAIEDKTMDFYYDFDQISRDEYRAFVKKRQEQYKGDPTQSINWERKAFQVEKDDRADYRRNTMLEASFLGNDTDAKRQKSLKMYEQLYYSALEDGDNNAAIAAMTSYNNTLTAIQSAAQSASDSAGKKAIAAQKKYVSQTVKDWKAYEAYVARTTKDPYEARAKLQSAALNGVNDGKFSFDSPMSVLESAQFMTDADGNPLIAEDTINKNSQDFLDLNLMDLDDAGNFVPKEFGDQAEVDKFNQQESEMVRVYDKDATDKLRSDKPIYKLVRPSQIKDNQAIMGRTVYDVADDDKSGIKVATGGTRTLQNNGQTILKDGKPIRVDNQWALINRMKESDMPADQAEFLERTGVTNNGRFLVEQAVYNDKGEVVRKPMNIKDQLKVATTNAQFQENPFNPFSSPLSTVTGEKISGGNIFTDDKAFKQGIKSIVDSKTAQNIGLKLFGGGGTAQGGIYTDAKNKYMAGMQDWERQTLSKAGYSPEQWFNMNTASRKKAAEKYGTIKPAQPMAPIKSVGNLAMNLAPQMKVPVLNKAMQTVGRMFGGGKQLLGKKGGIDYYRVKKADGGYDFIKGNNFKLSELDAIKELGRKSW
jgi:hypothetical protein